MNEPAQLRVYRFEPGAVFEGGLVGAVERMQLADGTELLDGLFVGRGAASGDFDAVDLAVGGRGGTFASLLDFRLEPGRRRAITERTLAEHEGGMPRHEIEMLVAGSRSRWRAPGRPHHGRARAGARGGGGALWRADGRRRAG